MKITKSMFYKETTESVELKLFANNDGAIYASLIIPICKNLKRKYNKGQYDKGKAVQAFYPVACEAAKLYNKQFGTPGINPFSVTDRWTVACDMESEYFDLLISDPDWN